MTTPAVQYASFDAVAQIRGLALDALADYPRIAELSDVNRSNAALDASIADARVWLVAAVRFRLGGVGALGVVGDDVCRRVVENHVCFAVQEFWR